MSIWTREADTFEGLPPERRVKIEIVSSAYASLFGEKSYLTMPVTTGRRFYEVLDRYKVKSIEELEQKRSGALREEIILPNIEDGKALASRIAPLTANALIVPGVFEARKERWTQDEYMVLWLKLINNSVSELYLSDGWEYSNGGAMEFAQACARELGLVGENALEAWDAGRNTIRIFDHAGHPMRIEKGMHMLASAIRDLEKRGYATAALRRELHYITEIAVEGADFAHNLRTYSAALQIYSSLS